MTRPHPLLTAGNELPRLTGHLARQLPWITELPGVVGVTLHGGLSRGYDGQIRIDRERLAAATGSDLYSWRLAVVEAVRGS